MYKIYMKALPPPCQQTTQRQQFGDTARCSNRMYRDLRHVTVSCRINHVPYEHDGDGRTEARGLFAPHNHILGSCCSSSSSRILSSISSISIWLSVRQYPGICEPLEAPAESNIQRGCRDGQHSSHAQLRSSSPLCDVISVCCPT